MKKLTTAIVLMSAIAIPGMAQEPASGMYFGAQYATVNIENGNGVDTSPTALVFQIGKEINKNFAIEGRFGMGMGDDSTGAFIGITPFTVTQEVDTFFGIYAKGIMPASDVVSLYGMVGFTDGTVNTSITDGVITISDSGSESDISFGVGVDFDVTKSMALNIEYMNYIDVDNGTLDALSVGITTKF